MSPNYELLFPWEQGLIPNSSGLQDTYSKLAGKNFAVRTSLTTKMLLLFFSLQPGKIEFVFPVFESLKRFQCHKNMSAATMHHIVVNQLCTLNRISV